MQKKHWAKLICDKNFIKLEIQRNILSLIKDTYKTPRANIVLNSDILNTFPLRLRMRQGCVLFILILASKLEILVSALRQEKIIKGTHFGKKEVKLSLQANWRLCL